jgi:fumarylacetoacetate (FAA) hydrolase
MKLVNFIRRADHTHQVGALHPAGIIPLDSLLGTADNPALASTLENFFYHPEWLEAVPALIQQPPRIYPLAELQIIAPIGFPETLRDFYAFEQHVLTAYKNRQQAVPKEWYEIPVFYFSNPGSIFDPEATIPYPKRSAALDYELEVACVIGKEGRDIPAEHALDYILGFTIMNDWSARDVQRQEMRVGLGPAKGKDFATSLGPWLVTPDELADRALPGRVGVYDLTMTARVNGIERSRGNWQALYYSFGQMIARASEDVTLLPGDVIGSGTVGTGCLLELTQGQGPWLQPGDVVELEIERLGVLKNTIGTR